jgi:hypothetical protein
LKRKGKKRREENKMGDEERVCHERVCHERVYDERTRWNKHNQFEEWNGAINYSGERGVLLYT